MHGDSSPPPPMNPCLIMSMLPKKWSTMEPIPHVQKMLAIFSCLNTKVVHASILTCPSMGEENILHQSLLRLQTIAQL
jgi:hypothetical protein